MDITSESLSGPAFAERVGISVDNLYDWRRRGIDLGAAASVNGRKSYSLQDVFEVFVLIYLRQEHYDDIKLAFNRARNVTPFVLGKAGIGGAKSPPVTSQGRYAFFDGKGQFFMSDDPSEHTRFGAPIVEVLDLKVIADKLRDKFKTEMSK